MPSFETTIRRALGVWRREDAQGQDEPVVPVAYRDTDGTTRALLGDADAIYTHAIARASSTGLSEVDVDAGEAQRLLADLAGRLWTRLFVGDAAVSASNPLPVALGGAWTVVGSALDAVDVEFTASADPCVIGCVSVTAGEATALYAFVFDGADASGALLERFYIPASGTSVRDFTTEGGRAALSGCYIALSTAADQITPPSVGGFFHVAYRA